jgi:ATPase subunit of ABC transporter with duplicated ATPase domains
MMKYPARPLMTVEKLTKKEHHQTLFRQLNLQITNETRLAIVGSNVQAKNALFEILGGLDKSFEGSVQILSQNTSLGVLPDHPVIREERVIGCIDEGLKKGEKLIAQWNELSDKVFDNIKFPQEIKKLSEQLEVIDEKAYEDGVALLFFLRKEAAKELGLPPAETRVDGLTEEERRKVVLVRLLVENHDILVLKDPTAAVEAQGSAWLANYLRRKRNKAVVLLSEDRALLQTVCRQVIDVDHLSEGICAGGYSAWLERRLADAKAAAEAEGTGLSPAQQRLATEMAWLRADNQTRRLDVLRKFQALYPPAPAPALPANDSADEELAAALVRDTPEEVPRRLKSIGLKAEHVRQSYGRNRAIEKFSFSLPAGSVAALLGPSIGKPTLPGTLIPRRLTRRPPLPLCLSFARYGQARHGHVGPAAGAARGPEDGQAAAGRGRPIRLGGGPAAPGPGPDPARGRLSRWRPGDLRAEEVLGRGLPGVPGLPGEPTLANPNPTARIDLTSPTLSPLSSV